MAPMADDPASAPILHMSISPDLDTVLNLQHSLADSQWWSLGRLRAHQDEALSKLVAHAYRTTPFHRDRLDDAGIAPDRPIDPDAWARLPILTRREVQAHAEALTSLSPPPAHGDVVRNGSSGSTGMPVTVLGTAYDALICKALIFRTYLWHGFDFMRRYAHIRKFPQGEATYPEGRDRPRWGDTATFPLATGLSCALNVETSADRQLEWLRRMEPTYLSTYPSLLRSLLIESERQGVGVPRLLKVMCTGETLDTDLRGHCQEYWGAELIDLYSAMEVDLIAAQCPEHPHYHVMAERLLVEVLDDDGKPCGPGETGRVVVTPLYNYAMPLLRYALGDLAEVGEPCACGRGLPVLRRIMGRVRNTMIAADGRRHWPSFGTRSYRALAPVVQHQFVQTAHDRLECRFVVERPLQAEEEAALLAKVRSRLPWHFELSVVYLAEIPRGPGGKYEDFYSEVAS